MRMHVSFSQVRVGPHPLAFARGRGATRLVTPSPRAGRSRGLFAIAVLLGMSVVTDGQTPPGLDWPQWQGPDRNGISKETGLLKEWPASGPPLVWSAANLGGGYGSI